MEIVTLIENTSLDSRLFAEHGLSLYIEAQGLCLLFDMGPSKAFLYNAAYLNVDIAQVDAAVVSHAHYDHGGGLEPFLAANHKAPVYLKVGADADYYANIGAKLPPWLLGVISSIWTAPTRCSTSWGSSGTAIASGGCGPTANRFSSRASGSPSGSAGWTT